MKLSRFMKPAVIILACIVATTNIACSIVGKCKFQDETIQPIGVYNRSIEQIESEIATMLEAEQEVRRRFSEALQTQSDDRQSIMAEMREIDIKNREFIVDLLDNFGWSDEFSEDTNFGIFMIIQHAPDLIPRYFPIIQKKADDGFLTKVWAATMEDRMLMMAGELQKYGTQLSQVVNDEGERESRLWPVENPDTLEERRAAIGLPPIDDYLQQIAEMMNSRAIWDRELTVDDFPGF
jgi:hypothetical protein